MVVHVQDREPVHVIRQGGNAKSDEAASLDLIGRRFMGTLFHPVSPGDMQKHFGVFHHGHRITVDWPAGATAEHPVCGGDTLQVVGRKYQVIGSIDRPGCYLDIYIEEA